MEAHTKTQIEALQLDANQPLVIIDADEVLVHFARPFAVYLEAEGWELRLKEYSLEYAIWQGGVVADAKETQSLVAGFIDTQTRHQPVIQGARRTLELLSNHAQIVILSNVPQRRFADRIANLAQHGMTFPLVTNVGLKGAALSAITGNMHAPTIFVDDSPAQIESAAIHVPHVHSVHFSGCPIVQNVLPEVLSADVTPRDWSGVTSYIQSVIR